MAVTHTNRRGQVYYLHTGRKKDGSPHWFMSMKSAGELAEAVPEGYEIYEKPESAQVFVRKISSRAILDEEVQLVRELVRQLAKTPYVIVDVEEKAIVLYAADNDIDGRLDTLKRLGFDVPRDVRAYMEGDLSYQPALRFSLEDAEKRTFGLERYRFSGMGSWLAMVGGGTLRQVAERSIPHLGAESYFERW